MNKVIKSSLKGLFAFALLLMSTFAFADQTTGIAGIANNITSNFQQLGQLMIAVAYIAGIGFFVASLFKFKQHKDNPTQIPLGTPITLLVISIALAFLPSFFKPAQETLFGSGGNSAAGGFTGQGASKLPQ